MRLLAPYRVWRRTFSQKVRLLRGRLSPRPYIWSLLTRLSATWILTIILADFFRQLSAQTGANWRTLARISTHFLRQPPLGAPEYSPRTEKYWPFMH